MEVGRFEIRDVARPEPGDNGVLVAIKSVGICGSDVHFYTQGRIGTDRCIFPQRLGHECSGVVVSDAGDSGFGPGDRVAIEPGRPCFTCEHCIKGHYNRCPRVKFLACPGMEGAFQEYLVVHARQLARLPDSLSHDEGAILEPLGVAYHAMMLADAGPADTVAIFGAGPIGLLTLAMAKARGVPETFIFDRLQDRVDFASRVYGADHAVVTTATDPLAYITEHTKGRGVTVAVEAGGEQQTCSWTYESAAIGGRCMMIGIPEVDEISYDPHMVRRRELLVQHVRRSNLALEPCIELIERGRINVKPLATHHYPLERITEAFELVSGYRDGVLRAMVTL
jgi:L-iditol 2-dehydrogenase